VLELRDYQHDLLEQARGLIRSGARSLIIQSPTGSGKTVLVAQMLKTAAERGYRAWFCVHRRELVNQSVRTLTESAGMDVGVVAAGFPGNRKLPVQVCSIGTLRNRRHALTAPSLIVWDECHHTAAKTWADIFEAYPNAAHVGLTATPERLDGTGLDKWFQHLVIGPSVAWLIEHGYLSKYRLFAPPPPNLSAVNILAGDYNRKELSAAMGRSTVTGDVISHYRRHAAGKRMIVFAWSIESSMLIAGKFRACGIEAEHVDGDTEDRERDAAMERFKRGETLVLTNVDLFGEGVDVPAMEAVALLRPTQSLTLYLQQVGRALRPSPGKDAAIILDHAGNCRRFGLPDDERVWSLEGRKRGGVRDDAAPIRQCPACYAVMSAAADRCGECGYLFVSMPREMNEVAGDLQEVEAASLSKFERLKEQANAKTLDDLIKIARLRNYKNPEKWAAMIERHRKARQAAREAAETLQRGLI
jgi:DNA repair protein RadD